MVIGSIVVSKAGRDRKKFFAVFQLVEKDRVYIVDGRAHKLNKPKLKNIKHLKDTGELLQTLATKWITGKKVFDSEIASSLKQYQDALDAMDKRQELTDNQ